MSDQAIPSSPAKVIKPQLSRDDWIMRAFILGIGVWLVVTLLFPLYAMLSKSFQNKDGLFIGLSNYVEYFSTPALFNSIENSFFISIVSTLITISLASVFAYVLARSTIPFKGVFKGIALLPLLAPSLLPGISFVYWFGRQGVLKSVMGDASIYGPIGIIMGEVFYTFPHALMILIAAFSIADGRLYEAADVLRTGRIRTFFTVTLPGIKYGLISAIFVVFTLVITDFGIPKVIGGQFNVLATDIYKQVIGQQNFEMGAVVSVVLLIPAIVAFGVDRFVQRKQVAMLTARAVPFEPKPNFWLNTGFFAYCCLIAILIVGVIGMAGYASFVTFWPYNLELSLKNYNFDIMDGGGWASFYNSLTMAAYTAVFGTVVIFTGAFMVEKAKGFGFVRGVIQFLCMIPMAVPGMVLGLAYIFFFNHPDNPLNFIYGTMPILVIVTIAHFYTVSHLTSMTALKQMDPEFETVSASLKVPFFRTFLRVTVPVCLPAILDISIYLFVNAMTTVSAVIFLYSSDTSLASIAALNMDDAGDVAPAAAMCMVIVATSATVRVFHLILSRGLQRKTQAWRKR